MKKTIFLSFAASLLISGSVMANNTPAMVQQAIQNGPSNVATSNSAIDDAILTRQRNYMNEKIRSNARKNIKNQWLRHTLSKSEAGVNTVSTIANRTGALQDSPFYSQRRATTNRAITAPNNSKRNFRTRAYDYYIDGGDAGTQVLQQDVIISSEHTVPTRMNARAQTPTGAADIIAAMRAIQKNRNTSEKVPTGEQKMTFRTGDSQRNFLHPFMNFNLDS